MVETRVLHRERRRFTVDEYDTMAEVGILGPEDRVELIEGEILAMAPIGVDHAFGVDWLADALARALQGQAILRVQGPLRLSDRSEPEPDILALRLPVERYRHRHPGAEDVLLLIEVADSSLRYDREVKLPLYARQGIPEVWIVDAAARRIEVYGDPERGEYRSQQRVGPAGTLSSTALPAVKLALAGLFGSVPDSGDASEDD